jgi:Glycosyl hydrolase family 36 C-terminal domain
VHHRAIVLEHATPDRTRGYAGLFRLAGGRDDVYRFRPRGLDASKSYKVTFDNAGISTRVSGLELERDGLSIRIGQPLRSELLLFEAQ